MWEIKFDFQEINMYVYKITNLINHKIYIGITNNYKKRWSNHRCGNSSNMIIGKAIKKYGVDNFHFEILYEGLTLDEANEMEIKLIKDFNSLTPNGYNISIGGGVIPHEGKKGANNNNAALTQEEAQYILDHRDQPMYVLYEQFNEKISYTSFKELYHHHTYTNLTTTTPEYPYNIEFSAQFTSGGKLDYDDIVLLRQRYKNGEYWETVYKDYRNLYPDKWSFWNIYNGNRFQLVMPEVFTKEMKKYHSSLGKQGERNSKAKLTSQDVLKIRELHNSGMKNTDIYKLFTQVTPTTIRSVINGTTWKNLL